ncbi:MAG: oxidoreductase, partial [Archangium gephyra]
MRDELRMRYVGQTALVTGASSGIGAEFAARVAAMGADVVLVGRRQDALESLAAKIAADTGRRSITMPLDLAGEGAAHELNARLNQLGVRVDILINCAGVGLTQDFVASTADEITQQIRLNAVALTEVT